MESTIAQDQSYCGHDCLLNFLPDAAVPIQLGKKDNTKSAYCDGESLWLPIQNLKPERLASRLLGGYRTEHRQALQKLADNGSPFIVPVLGLCDCTYRIPLLQGKVLFDANTIPEIFRDRQGEYFSARINNATWSFFVDRMYELLEGLIHLHQIGLAHGDITVFNVFIQESGHAVFIDLENLNTDPEQRVKDCISFLLFVVLFLYDLLEEVPQGFLDDVKKILQEENNLNDVYFLQRLQQQITAEYPLLPADQVDLRSEIFSFCESVAVIAAERKGIFFETVTKLLGRSSVYFQQNFLWLVNFNMKSTDNNRTGFQNLLNGFAALSSDCRKMLENMEQRDIAKTGVEHETDLSSLREQLTAEQRRGRSLLAVEQKKNADLFVELENSRNEIQELQKKNLETEIKLKNANDCVIDLEQKVLDGQEALDTCKARMQETEKRLAHVQGGSAILEKHFIQVRSLADSYYGENIRLKDDLSLEQGRTASLQTALDQNTKQLAEQNTLISQLRQEVSDLQNELADAIEKVQENHFLAKETEQLVSYVQHIEQEHFQRFGLFSAALRDQMIHFRNCLIETSNYTSFRLAKIFQVLKHPQWFGFSGRLSFLFKAVFAKIRHEQFMPHYRALSHLETKWDDLEKTLSIMQDMPAAECQLLAEMPLITIVLPVYNHAALVGEALESIITQTYENWELLIINDGSTDGLDEVVQPYLLKDKRIRYLVQENQKLPRALSNAFRFARGEFLTWTSADNRMRPDMLKKLCCYLLQHPEKDMVYADYEVIDGEGKPFCENWFRPANKWYPEDSAIHLPHSTVLLNRIQDNFIGACFMYRREKGEMLGGYDTQLGVEDYDYWMRMNDLFAIGHLGTSDLLYEYRVHDNSLSAQAQELRIFDKAVELMKYEKKRRAYYFTPFHVYGSYRSGDLDFGGYPCELHDDIPGEITEEKSILLLKGSELRTMSDRENLPGAYQAVFFYENEERVAGACSPVLKKPGTRCFAPVGSVVASWLQVFTRNVTACDVQCYGRNALAAANNYLFCRQTRTEQDRTTLLPRATAQITGTLVILVRQLGYGGLEQVAYDMIRVFRAQGIRVELMSLRHGEAMPPDDITLTVAETEEDFIRYMREWNVECVLAHFAPEAWQYCAKAGIPFHQVIHNSYAWLEADEQEKLKGSVDGTVSFIAVSCRAAWYTMEKFAVPPEKMIVIENEVSSQWSPDETIRKNAREKFGYTEDNFVFLQAATCYGVKGHLNLVLAFARAYKQNPALRLIMAGNITEEWYGEKIRWLIGQNGLEKVVQFGVRYDDMQELWNLSDAAVLPSFWEGCSLAVAESIHMKRPILATRTGDIERQTCGRNCILLDPPYDYLTDLDCTTYGGVLFTESEELIDGLCKGMLDITAGNYRHGDYPAENGIAHAYVRYLHYLAFLKSGYTIEQVRHNLDAEGLIW